MPRALLSVYDKTGIVEFATSLHELGWSLLSSGGTAAVISAAGIPVTDVAEITGLAPILDHRVVTLHPKIHGGILADRSIPEHVAEMEKNGIEGIDLVVVNLYPFSSKPGIELIDIGGPAMVRAAAKNFAHVGVVVDTADYSDVLEMISGDFFSIAARRRLAQKAFRITSAYDASISSWLADETSDREDATVPPILTLVAERAEVLRYGENPHQTGTLYRLEGSHSWWSSAEQLGGKEMSYLNVFDADAAWKLVHQFSDAAAVVVKHANPCGVATGSTISDAYRRAHACDPVSAFGGIIALNREVDEVTAQEICNVFTEVVIAPAYSESALHVLQSKKNLRIMRATAPQLPEYELRSVSGGVLVQSPDGVNDDPATWTVASSTQPTPEQLQQAGFAWKVCAAVSSNAIVVTQNNEAVGIGGGQQNRLDAARLACERAGTRAVGGVAASDAFFPFRDGLDMLAAAGVHVVVEPGGSVRDEEVIAAAHEPGIVLLFTGARHFRH